MPTAQRMVCAGGILSIQKNSSRTVVRRPDSLGRAEPDAGDEDFIAPHAHGANIEILVN